MSGWLGITGSAAYDVVACPPRVALPRCKEAAGERAERGNELHLFCQRVSEDPTNRPKWEELVSEEYRHTAKGINLDAALEGIEVLGCEVAFVLNVKDRTCRMIGRNIDRQYEKYAELGKYDIPFTVDVLGRSTDLGTPVELDYKSGQSIGEVEEHGQRKISSTGLMLHYGTDEAISRVAYIWESGEIKHDGHEFSVLDADEVCETMVAAIDAACRVIEQLKNRETPTVFPDRDKQCKYCDAFHYCPYWNNLAHSATNGAPEGWPSLEQIEKGLSAEELGRTFNRVKDVLKVLLELEDKLKERVKKGEDLPIDAKWEFRGEERNGKEYFDASAARGLLVTLLGRSGLSDEEITAEMAKLTKTGKPYIEVKRRKRLPVVSKNAA